MTHINVASRIHLSLACAAVAECLSLNPYIIWNSTQSRPGTGGLRQELSDLKIAGNRSAIKNGDVSCVEIEQLTMPKNQKPLAAQRGAGASIGEIEKRGNHEIVDFSFPAMLENHSYRTPLGLITQSPSDYRGFHTANLEAQREVA